jgi:hypothetical protein
MPKLAPRAAPKTIPIKPVTAWSFSRYSDYKQCPLRFKLKHIDKIKEPESPAMMNGLRVHTMAEEYIKGKLKKLPPELVGLKEELAKLQKLYKRKTLPMIVEDQWGFDKTWNEAAWDDWANCWLRIKLDCAHYEEGNVLYIRDWKTGKMSMFKNTEYMEQLELYALCALLMSVVEDVVVVPEIGWTETGEFYPPENARITFSRADIPRLKKLWEKRIAPMFNDKTFAPKPNKGCQWCHYSAAKAGPCKF